MFFFPIVQSILTSKVVVMVQFLKELLEILSIMLDVLQDFLWSEGLNAKKLWKCKGIPS